MTHIEDNKQTHHTQQDNQQGTHKNTDSISSNNPENWDEQINTHNHIPASEDKNINENTNNEIETLKEKLARSQADYQNLLMRAERDKKDMTFFITEKLLRWLLIQIDHLDRAIKIKDNVQGDAFVDGVRSVQTGLMKYLETHNVTPFNSIGQEVDPDRHDVISQMPGKEGIIIQEFEKWYEYNGRVLRHAKVIVGVGE